LLSSKGGNPSLSDWSVRTRTWKKKGKKALSRPKKGGGETRALGGGGKVGKGLSFKETRGRARLKSKKHEV